MPAQEHTFTIEFRPTCTITATSAQLKLMRQAIDIALESGRGTEELRDWDAAQLFTVVASDRMPAWLRDAPPT